MFLDNKYTKWYNNIIKKAQNRKIEPSIKYDKHHIIPKCMGGDNSKENLVYLTLKEHYIVHLLLLKMVDEKYNFLMSYAFNTMSNTRRYNSNIFVNIRTKFYNEISLKRKGVKKTTKHIENMKGQRPHVSQKGEKNNAFTGYYITPWGKFASVREAVETAPFKIKCSKISQACKYLNNNVIKVNRNTNFPVGYTYKELGYSFEKVSK